MATAVVMPKQGQTVESCIIVEWKKQPGDPVAEGETLAEVETDKAVVEVPSPVGGTLLARFFEVGEDVPVLTTIAAVGAPGEAVDDLAPAGVEAAARVETAPPTPVASADASQPALQPTPQAPSQAAAVGISPRALHLAQERQIDLSALQGSGPGGRIIERDVQAALAGQPKISPVARAMVEHGGFSAPTQGTGPGGRIMARDLNAEPAPFSKASELRAAEAGEVSVVPVKGVRKVIADRMLASLQTTAQLTLNSSADARALLALRKRFKAGDEALGLQGITINDLVLFAVTRVLPRHPMLNALFQDDAIHHYGEVNLGFAVDTPRGLLVPVVHGANRLSLRALAEESKRLAAAAQAGKSTPDELAGGTFTVTNLGHLGVEHFTPILNPPQVAILGVGNINLKPVEVEGELEFIPHIGLSLTINHQVVDGAPGARFLQALCKGLADLELLLAI